MFWPSSGVVLLYREPEEPGDVIDVAAVEVVLAGDQVTLRPKGVIEELLVLSEVTPPSPILWGLRGPTLVSMKGRLGLGRKLVW